MNELHHTRQKPLSPRYLTCERYYIFELLICAGGMLGAYTYNLRGGVLMTLCCGFFAEKAVWLTMVPLLVSFAILSRADLNDERDRLNDKPAGH